MNYRSVSDLSFLTNRHVSRVPQDIELIVGIPRSGMLVASIISLKLNLPLTDLYSFLRNDELKKGNTRTYKHNQLQRPWEASKILLVDDSIASGKSMEAAVAMVRDSFAGEVVTMAAFAQRDNTRQVDMFLETVEQPRLFEWNIMHHHLLSNACLSIDGVLCVGPAPGENDDGPNYRRFLQETSPLFIPSIKVAHLVTNRLEKYRAETEDWLARHGVEYGQLHMLELPNDQQARRLKVEAPFKAKIFSSDPHAILFIEGNRDEALEIMKISNKPAFCVTTNEMFVPGRKLPAMKVQMLRKSLSLKAKLAGRVRQWLGRESAATP